MHLCTNLNPGLSKVLSSILYQKSLQYWTFLLCESVNGPHWDLWPNLAVWERWGNGRWIDVRRCSNDCLSCLETHPQEKKPNPKCPGALVCCVCVCVSMQPCVVAKQTSALALRTTAAEKGFSHHLSPPTKSVFLFFLSPTRTSFSLSFPARPFPYDRTDRKLSSRSHCLRTLSP